MKRLLFFLMLVFTCGLAIGQDTLQKVYVPKVGFTFYIPAKYEVTKPVPKHHNDDDPILLISNTDKRTKTIMRITIKITKVTDSTTRMINNVIPYMKFSLAAAQASEKNLHLDTLFTKVKIEGRVIDKVINGGEEYGLGYRSTSVYLGQNNSYYFSIGIYTDDKNLRDKIHSLIEAGKFDN